MEENNKILWEIKDENFPYFLCPIHKVRLTRRKSQYGDNYWHSCPFYPNCDVTAQEHPDRTVMSYPSDKETKNLRSWAHNLMVKVFGAWEDKQARKEMYDWLKLKAKQNVIGEAHIGKCNKSELEDLINELSDMSQEDYDDPQDETKYDLYQDFPF